MTDGVLTECRLRPDFARIQAGEHAVALQPLRGFARVIKRESEPQRRTHILSWHSALLVAETERIQGEQDLVALTWCGKNMPAGEAWRVAASEKGRLVLHHSQLGEWKIAHADFPQVPAPAR